MESTTQAAHEKDVENAVKTIDALLAVLNARIETVQKQRMIGREMALLADQLVSLDVDNNTDGGTDSSKKSLNQQQSGVKKPYPRDQ